MLEKSEMGRCGWGRGIRVEHRAWRGGRVVGGSVIGWWDVLPNYTQTRTHTDTKKTRDSTNDQLFAKRNFKLKVRKHSVICHKLIKTTTIPLKLSYRENVLHGMYTFSIHFLLLIRVRIHFLDCTVTYYVLYSFNNVFFFIQAWGLSTPRKRTVTLTKLISCSCSDHAVHTLAVSGIDDFDDIDDYRIKLAYMLPLLLNGRREVMPKL